MSGVSHLDLRDKKQCKQGEIVTGGVAEKMIKIDIIVTRID